MLRWAHAAPWGQSLPAEQTVASMRNTADAGPNCASVSLSDRGSPSGAAAAVHLAHPAEAMGHTHGAQDSAQLGRARLGSGVLLPGSAAPSQPAFPQCHSVSAWCHPCRHWGVMAEVNRATFLTPTVVLRVLSSSVQ